MNSEINIARRYHDQTKHSYWSIRTTPHYLDWNNKPEPFKVYPTLTPIALPRDLPLSGVSTLDALSENSTLDRSGELTVETLATLLFYTAGVTKSKPFPGGVMYFRAAPCAGALYPIELYVVCGGIEGLTPGVYHFNPGDFSLRMLREGDYRAELSEMAGGSEVVARSPVTLVFSAISWRSTWKYRSRAYRYHYWDSGTMLAHSIALSAAHNIKHQLFMGFVDEEVNRLIGVDGSREFSVALATLGEPGEEGSDRRSALDPIDIRTIPLSRQEVDYPIIGELHKASSLSNKEEVEAWRGSRYAAGTEPSGPTKPSFELLPLDGVSSAPLEEVIQRRASTRRFALKPISFEELSTIIEKTLIPVESDLSLTTNTLYLIANDVQGLQSGAYYFNANIGSLEQLRAGNFRREAAHLTLDQDLGGQASVTFFLMADLDRVLETFGNRGYRVAEIEAGIIGGRTYLAAYALGRGATGLTFYDDDVTEFFSPHARGKSCMLVVSVGVPGKPPIY